MMRIITGTARGTKLLSPEGITTRPTSERAKEAVFSVLAFDVPGRRVLDLFAGSGQLALEALSRGAQSAVLVDSAASATDVIRKNVVKTHMEQKASVVRMDCLSYLKSARPDQPFDLIFIDPPYIKRLVPDMLTMITERGLASNVPFLFARVKRKTFSRGTRPFVQNLQCAEPLAMPKPL